MRGPLKIVDSYAIFGVFNIENWRIPPKIVDPCAILCIFNNKKIRRPPIYIDVKIEIRKVRRIYPIKK